MEFNPSKCQVVLITRSRRPINTTYSMHGQVLDFVESARYLGTAHYLKVSGGGGAAKK